MKSIKRAITWILTVLLVINMFPAVYAASGDSVLTSIGHSDTDTVALSGSERQAVLTVPHDYPGAAVDLTSGLMISYDDELYKSVVVFPEAQAVVDGEAVKVTITFNESDEEDGAEKGVTEYFVSVVKAPATPPTFSGVISEEIEYPDESFIDFTDTDFTGLYNQNDGEDLGYITISGSNLAVGTLMYYGAPYAFGTPVSKTNLGLFDFTAAGCGQVSYDISAYGATTSELIGTAVLTIKVYAAPEIEHGFSMLVYRGSTHTFKSLDFTDNLNLFGMPLLSVEITPTNFEFGTWELFGAAITGTTEIPANQIGGLTFKGSAAGLATFIWRASNIAGYSDYGMGAITVAASAITISDYSAATSLLRGSVWTVSEADFKSSPSTVPLTYIKISSIPAVAEGNLFLTTNLPKNDAAGYGAITANQALAVGAVIPQSYLKYLRIATKSTGTGTAISFTWTATADSVVSTAVWAAPASYSVKYLTGGSVSYETYANVPVTLRGSDFDSSFLSSAGFALSYVTFTLPDKAAGTLYYNYSQYTKTGTAVAAATKYYTGMSPNISYLTFVPTKDYTGTVTVAYKGYKADGTFLAGELKITVSNSGGGTVVYSTDKNADVQFDAADFAKSFLNATGKTLSYVRFSLPSTAYGRLYYDYVSSTNFESSVSSSTKYYLYTPDYLSYVSFVPDDDYTGTVTVSYTAYDTSGNGYTGRLIIFVVDSPAGIVSYTSKVNGTTRLDSKDFADEFISVTGSVLASVKFTLPVAGLGTLYYNYSADTGEGTKVTSSTPYYCGSAPDISNITFVPATDLQGEVVIKYTAVSASGASFEGKLKISVGDASSGVVSYETDLNTALDFYAGDFVGRYYSNTGGSVLSYVTFALPDSSYGKLYYNYTSSSNYGALVTAGTKYYVNSSPYLSDVTFVPKTGYSGSFTLTYTGYASDGTGYTGKVKITVSGDGTVTYETTSRTPVAFRSSDFVSAFSSETGGTLSYVKFSLPPTSSGVLYYGYSSEGSYNSTVSYTTKYYVNSSPLISNIKFVPNVNFTGSVAIDYIAYDSEGDAFGGTVLISVTGKDGGEVHVEVVMNNPITLDSDDFYSAFAEQTGNALYYVTFTPPSATFGQLYYGYTSPIKYSSKVTAATKYYRSISPLLSDVTFVPVADYTGTVSIDYTGYTAAGTSYAGVLTIDVRQPFNDVGGYSWAGTAIAYLYNSEVVNGTGDGQFRPGASMSRGDFMLMVFRAFDLSSPALGSFDDVYPGSYYFEAIATAKALGIAEGASGSFFPDREISRQDAMVLVLRTLAKLGRTPAAGSAGDLAGFSDAGEISDYALAAMQTLVKAGVITGSGGALNPRDNISRAEMAVLLYRVLTVL